MTYTAQATARIFDLIFAFPPAPLPGRLVVKRSALPVFLITSRREAREML